MISVADLIRDHEGLVKELARYDYESVAPLVGGFLTLPQFHGNAIRLAALAHLACYACRGKRQADRETLVRCAGRRLADSKLVSMEDPVEGPFVGNVATAFGNFRVFPGIEESGDYWSEQILRPLEAPDTPEPIKPSVKQIRALLTISDAVAERRRLQRYAFGSGQFSGRLTIPQWRDLVALAQAVTFLPRELEGLGILRDDLSPFTLRDEQRDRLPQQTTGQTELERYPLAQFEEKIVLVAPHAVTLSIRRFLVEQLDRVGLIGVFETLLQTRQFETWQQTLHHGLRFEPMDVSLPMPSDDLPTLYQAVMRFDEGKYAHLVLLDGNIRQQRIDSHGTDELSDKQKGQLDQHLLRCAELLRGLPGFNGGMTLITRGGLGRGLAISINRIPEWGIIFATLADWHTLACCEDMSSLRLWRMWRHQRWAEQHGLKIMNLSGAVNLYACWRSNGWRFSPQQMLLSQPRKLLAVGTDFIANVRKEVLHAHDEHSCLAHDGSRWIRVERRGARAYYSCDRTAPVYVSLGAAGQGILVGSIETANRNWWVACKTVSTTTEERGIRFQLWDCLLNWINRAMATLEKEFRNLSGRSIWIELDVLDLAKWADDSSVPEQTLSALQAPTVDPRERKIIITLPFAFAGRFHVPENQAERMIMDCVLRGIAELTETLLLERDRIRLLSAIFPNDQARYFHLVRTENWAQMLVGPSRPEPDFIPEEECSQSLIALSEEVGKVPLGEIIRGRSDCIKYLEQVGNKLWEGIECRLRRFDRHSVVANCFTALAELERDAEHWNMAAQALLALHAQVEVLELAEQRKGEREIATLANRLLIETSMYATSPTGGDPLPNAERLELLARLKNLLSTANHRDAISEGFMPAEIRVHPNGEVDVNDQFYAAVMSPYVRAVFAKGFRLSAAAYVRWFSNYQKPKSPDAEVTLKRMEQPFYEEFGTTLNQFVAMPHHFGRLALKEKKLVLEFHEASLRAFLAGVCKLGPNGAEMYLSRFSLPPRPAWNKGLPDGCRENDVWPWRFRRRLSLLMRPLVLLQNAPDRRWLVYPPLVHKSAIYLVGNIAEAAFPTEHFQSQAMLAFCGDQAKRRGNQFALDVADIVERSGFLANRHVQMSALGVPASAGDLGDVDVLAWKPGSTAVLIIECKYLRTAVSVRDVVDRLDEYRGERDDSLGKHLRRLNWLKANPASVSAMVGFPMERIRFKGLLVTDDLVPMQFFSGSPISPQDVVSADHLTVSLEKPL